MEKWKTEIEGVQNLISQTSAEIQALQSRLNTLSSDDAWTWRQQFDILQNKLKTDLESLETWKQTTMAELDDTKSCHDIVLEHDRQNMQNIENHIWNFKNMLRRLSKDGRI
jgi:predicted  nucleic acid-binding Zn-ribbon protein